MFLIDKHDFQLKKILKEILLTITFTETSNTCTTIKVLNLQTKNVWGSMLVNFIFHPYVTKVLISTSMCQSLAWPCKFSEKNNI